MQKRKISTIIILNIITLGLYQLYWLVKTCNEIARKLQTDIPSATWLVASQALQIACLLFIAYVFLIAIPADNRKTNSIVKPSSDCLARYLIRNESEHVEGIPYPDQNCIQQADKYFQPTSNKISYLAGGVLVAIAAPILTMMPLLKRWFVPFAEAIATVTEQRVSSTTAMILLTLAPPTAGMVAIQSIFNKLE